MTVIFRPQAVEDVVKASAWYEAHGPGLLQRRAHVSRILSGEYTPLACPFESLAVAQFTRGSGRPLQRLPAETRIISFAAAPFSASPFPINVADLVNPAFLLPSYLLLVDGHA